MIRKSLERAPRPFVPQSLPAWVTAHALAGHDIGPSFAAGAALTGVDAIVRAAPDWAGVWRQRLALKCAVACIRLNGRSEDEAALRDAWILRKPGDSLGPAGNILLAWRKLANRRDDLTIDGVREVAGLLGVRMNDALADIPDWMDDLSNGVSPPSACASILSRICGLQPDAEALAWWIADRVLAQSLRWSVPVPLLMAHRFSSAFRLETGRGRVRPDDDAFERAVCLALVQGAQEACRLAIDLTRRADRLAEVAPKLRAKGAGDVLALLLQDDAVSGSLQTPKLSRFAARRLFDRLIEFDAVRELSGRSIFRVYGL